MMCSVNRLSIYVLLLIMINLSFLTYSLLVAMIWGETKLHKKRLNALSTLVPLLLIIVGFALEG
jgi:hypothetical protein